jgi:hypothetical protein
MEISGDSRQCPVCGYEFPGNNSGLKWVAILLAVLFLIYMLF